MKHKGLLLTMVVASIPLFQLWAQSSQEPESSCWLERVPVAVKSNLLLDGATLANLSAEVGLGDCWSLSFDAVTPWWDSNDNGKVRTTRMMLFGGEGRWYMHRWKSASTAFAGPYLGVYGYGGRYDICRWSDAREKSRGYRSENLFSAGIDAGYSFRISQWWRLDLTVGVGYIQSDYKHYDVIHRKYRMKHYNGSFSNVLPTRAGISVSWLIGQCRQHKISRQKGDAR